VPENEMFWIEKRFGLTHVAFRARHRLGILPTIAVHLGFGISFLSSMARWTESENKITDIWLIPNSQAQSQLDNFLRKVRKARSLEIRNSQAPLDYSSLTQLKNLKHLSIQGKIAKDLDLTTLSKLQSFSGSNSSISHVHGLSNLRHLCVVNAYDASSVWLKTLPLVLKTLTLYGKFPINLEISKFQELHRLNFARSRQLDFTSLKSKSGSLKVLGIRDIKVIRGINLIPVLFPNLEEIRVCALEEGLVSDLQKLYNNKCTMVEWKDF